MLGAHREAEGARPCAQQTGPRGAAPAATWPRAGSAATVAQHARSCRGPSAPPCNPPDLHMSTHRLRSSVFFFQWDVCRNTHQRPINREKNPTPHPPWPCAGADFPGSPGRRVSERPTERPHAHDPGHAISCAQPDPNPPADFILPNIRARRHGRWDRKLQRKHWQSQLVERRRRLSSTRPLKHVLVVQKHTKEILRFAL
jgi:hypothetical protein